MRQVPLERDINIAINGPFWVEVANPEHPFTAMLISRSRDTCLTAEPTYSLLHVSGKTRTPDKYRVVYTDHQRLELEKEYQFSKYITIRRKAELAQALSLSERQVLGPYKVTALKAGSHSLFAAAGQDLVPEPARQGAEAGEEVRQADRRGEVQCGHESAARGRCGHVRDAARPALGHGGGGDGAHAAPLAPAALTRGRGRRRIGRDVESTATAKEAKARMDLTLRRNSETGVCDDSKYIRHNTYMYMMHFVRCHVW